MRHAEFKTFMRLYLIAVIAVMTVLFILNPILSTDCDPLMIILTGGGKLVDYLGAAYDTVYEDFQIYRLITYGYFQPAVWHLLANAFALWYVGLYMEKVIGSLRFIIIYHIGLIVSCVVFLLLFQNGLMYGASPAIFCFFGMMASWLIKDRALLDEYINIKGSRYLLCVAVISNFLSVGTFVVHVLGFCVGILIGFVVKRKG
ncbi:MAG: rhomboid family intramembrane serine protease [Lachnospiraceae bacterium]|nr:rhomboid family intramembrane serine protease [Lachnospiraceae bacterium]